MLEAETRMRKVLAAASLADLMTRVAAKAPPGFAIDVSNWLGERSATRRGGAQKSARGHLACKARRSAPG